ncbi:VirC2 family conjugal transfer protein [Aquamicrobium terrae]
MLAERYDPVAPISTAITVQTFRMIPKGLVAIARAHFDPLGFETTRAFGMKLGTAALAAFFSREVRGH